MEKKITCKDYCYMTRRANVPWFQKISCTYHLYKGTEGRHSYYQCRRKVRWFWYLLLWLPLQIVNILYYMWTEGLREWDWDLPRVDRGACFYVYDNRYEDSTYSRMDKIWESY